MNARSSDVYKRLIEGMNEAVALNDEQARIVYANPKYCQLTGYSLSEVVGKQEYDFWDENTRKKVRSVNNNERKRGVSSTYEGSLLTKNKKRIPVLVSGSPMPDGGTMGIFTDLRELKKKEQKEVILANALQNTAEAIVVFDEKGTVRLWNNGAKLIFGYKNKEMEGQLLQKLFAKDDILTLLLTPEKRANLDIIALHKNKSPLSFSCTINPLPQRGNELRLYLMIGRDISSYIKFEEEVTLKYQKMKEAYNQFGILRRQMDYVFELIELLKTETNKRTITDFIVSSIAMLTRVDACILRRYEPVKKKLNILSAFGIMGDWWGRATIPFRNTLTEKAAKLGKPLKIVDLSKEPKYHSAVLARKHNFSSLLLIPLFYEGEFIAALSLYATAERKLEIFENEFIEKYAQLIELVMGTLVGRE